MQWPPTPGPGRELHEPERLGRRRVDDLPDVQAHPLAQERQVVDERDVDVAEDVLEQLRQLRRVGRGHRDDLLVDVAQEGRGALGAGLGRRADEPRHALAGTGRVARVDPLRREGEIEVRARLQARLLEDLAERAGRRAREGRGLEDDQLAGPQVAADRLGGGQDRGEIGVLRRGDRRRDAHEDRVGGRDARVGRGDDGQAARSAPRRGARPRRHRSARSRRSVRRPAAGRRRCPPRSGRPRRTRSPAAGPHSRGRSRPLDGLDSRSLPGSVSLVSPRRIARSADQGCRGRSRPWWRRTGGAATTLSGGGRPAVPWTVRRPRSGTAAGPPAPGPRR